MEATANHRRVEAPKLIKLVRGDLDWIVMKALEKDRTRRYETANGLGMDVRCHLDDEPVVARPPGNLYRFQKTVRRNKLAFAAATAVAAALVAGMAFSTWQFVEKNRAVRDQIRLREEAEKQELATRRIAYAVSMNLIQKALREDNVGRAIELLNKQRPKPGQEDLRGWEWRYLWQFCRNDVQTTLCARSNLITSVSFPEDGALLAVATEPGEISIWDITGNKMTFRDINPGNCIPRVAFAPAGDLLAYAFGTNVIIWNSKTRTEVNQLPVGEGLKDHAFIRGNRLVTATVYGTNNITVWDTITGHPVSHLGAQLTYNEEGTANAAIKRSADRHLVLA